MKRPGRGRKEKVEKDAESSSSWLDDFRSDDSFQMRPVYAVLLTITMIALILTLLYPFTSEGLAWLNPIVDRFGANVTTEGFALTFTLVFVNRFLEQQD